MIKFLSNTLETLSQQPVILLILIGIPLMIVAGTTRVFPSKKALWLVTLPALVSLAFAITPDIGWYVVILDLLVIFLLIVDLFTIVPRGKFVAQRK